MLRRRTGLLAVAVIVLLGVTVNVDAGPRKRQSICCVAYSGRSVGAGLERAMGKPTTRFQAPLPSNAGSQFVDVDVQFCPQWIAYQNGGTCTFYAIKCEDGVVIGPVPYYAACDIPHPQEPCACDAGTFARTAGALLAFTADGFGGELTGPVTPPDRVAVKVPVGVAETATIDVRHSVLKNVIVKATIPSADGKSENVQIQLLSVATTPQHPLDARIKSQENMGTLLFHSGRQIAAQENVDVAVDATQVRPIPGFTKAFTVRFQGDDYVVLLQKD